MEGEAQIATELVPLSSLLPLLFTFLHSTLPFPSLPPSLHPFLPSSLPPPQAKAFVADPTAFVSVVAQAEEPKAEQEEKPEEKKEEEEEEESDEDMGFGLFD